MDGLPQKLVEGCRSRNFFSLSLTLRDGVFSIIFSFDFLDNNEWILMKKNLTCLKDGHLYSNNNKNLDQVNIHLVS